MPEALDRAEREAEFRGKVITVLEQLQGDVSNIRKILSERAEILGQVMSRFERLEKLAESGGADEADTETRLVRLEDWRKSMTERQGRNWQTWLALAVAGIAFVATIAAAVIGR